MVEYIVHSISACTVHHLGHKQKKRFYAKCYTLVKAYFYTKRLALRHSESEIAGN